MHLIADAPAPFDTQNRMLARLMRDAVASRIMRTTLDIDDDILQAAKSLARREKRSAGAIISELARQSLTQEKKTTKARETKAIYGFKPLSKEPGLIVTNEMINRLREEDGE